MVVHEWLRLSVYKAQLLQATLPRDKTKRAEFAIEMLHHINKDEGSKNRCASVIVSISYAVSGQLKRRLQDLKSHITDAFTIVTDDLLQLTWQEIEYILAVIKATHGVHIEIRP
ncbi:hypothetical protein NPIL_31321 [Nephila pilipes]|uniref:Uncharacterized protein n=1 Tax=Nephila pilipes TaxID=299642 RepID=A0A8X6TKV2_NEPPI|nr:hypothetical protein NPIL_31321 [Nephila pilipes]